MWIIKLILLEIPKGSRAVNDVGHRLPLNIEYQGES